METALRVAEHLLKDHADLLKDTVFYIVPCANPDGFEANSGKINIGHIGNIAAKGIDALEAEGYSVAHYDMRFAKPIDELLLHEVFGKFKHVVTIEDGCIQGGMGSAVLEFMADHGYHAHVKRLGIPDRWIEHGTQPELYAECGFDEKAVSAAVREMLGAKGKAVRVSA